MLPAVASKVLSGILAVAVGASLAVAVPAPSNAVPVTAAGAAFDTSAAAQALVRLIGADRASQVSLRTLPGGAGDRFQIVADGQQLVVAGTSPATLLTGFGWYLKRVAHADISLNGEQLNLPTLLPLPAAAIEHQSSVEHRFALNDTNEGYGGPYLSWAAWEHRIDVLALHGINEVLVYEGQDAVYEQTFQPDWLDPTNAFFPRVAAAFYGAQTTQDVGMFSSAVNGVTRLSGIATFTGFTIAPHAERDTSADTIRSLGQPVGTLSNEPGNPPQAANDGSRANTPYWGGLLTWGGPLEQYNRTWWQVDLGQPTNVSSINVRNYVDGRRPYTYQVLGGLDGTNWFVLGGKADARPAADTGETFHSTLRSATCASWDWATRPTARSTLLRSASTAVLAVPCEPLRTLPRFPAGWRWWGGGVWRALRAGSVLRVDG
jgi:hypothetical protein